MFVILLGGSLVVGASLFAVASYSQGALVALGTAVQVIGWLLLVTALASVAGLRRGALAEISTAAVALCSGLALLYMAAGGDAPVEPAPAPLVAYKLIEPEVTRASIQAAPPADIPRAAKSAAPLKQVAAVPRAIALAAAPCAAFDGLQSVQCSRCNERSGLAWIVCQERVRLEYCESEQGNEALCPSPIPQSAPG